MQPAKLTTFVPPRASPRLMRVVEALNRRLLLSGIPGLRNVPGTSGWPLVVGVAKVRHIDLLAEDEARLRALLAPGNVTFVAANHPEHFTDWVIGRELAARFAPEMAQWVPASLVNGHFQPFWLRNNMLPTLVGPDGNPVKTHSLDWALKGKGVLLHPEASSAWHGHEIAPIYPAIAEMALRAQMTLERKGSPQTAHILPVVWKLRFIYDEDDALHREVDYVEGKLGLRGNASERLETRVYGLTEQLLEREEVRCEVLPLYSQSFVQRWESLYALTVRKIFGAESAKFATLNPQIVVRHAQRQLASTPVIELRWLQSMRWLVRFSPHRYPGKTLTQEQLAEIIKRVRQDHCEGAWADRVHQILPSPVGPRIAYVAVAPALSLAEYRQANPRQAPDAAKEALTRKLRAQMQGALDALNRRVTDHSGYVLYANPYWP